jgi:hypothetical protein
MLRQLSYHPIDGTTPGAGTIHTINGPRTDDTLRYGYDWQNRLTLRELVADNANVQRSEQVQFDSLGRMDVLTNGLGVFDYLYNSGNIGPRVDAVAGPSDLRTDFSYYPASAPGGKALLLSGIDNKWDTTGLSSFGYDYTYSLAGQLLGENYCYAPR